MRTAPEGLGVKTKVDLRPPSALSTSETSSFVDPDLATSIEAVEQALDELRNGRMILVVDSEDRENEGDLIMAAEFATQESMAFMIRHTSGIICVAIPEDRAEQLSLPLMVTGGDDPHGTAFTVSVDKRGDTTTGVSAADRAATVRALAGRLTQPADLCRPGHIFPLRARSGGVLKRSGHTESAVDLCRLAGLEPAGVLAEVTNADGTMARSDQLRAFAEEHGLTMITVADLVRYRCSSESLVRMEGSGRIPLGLSQWRALAFRSVLDDIDHVALVLGDVDQADPQNGATTPVLARVHSECVTGDVFGSRRCDCGEQLSVAISRIGAEGRGVIVYLRGQEGRGIGLAHKLRAYSLQDQGLDTVEANLAQGLPVDSREYGIGAQILRALGVRDVRLMTNNPAKYTGLAGHGVRIVSREPIVINPNPASVAYLRTKHQRMGHDLRISDIS
jgi:3,4-dihydroxy 2-butanone 4-phosphate synthase/GTP cyclohydrolase II